jgi:cytoskeleton-associated protein 5
MTGYEECVNLFRTQNSDQSPEFNKYVNLMKKFVIDSNENAREKALDAVLAFVEEANIAGKWEFLLNKSYFYLFINRTVNEVSSGLIAKCLNSRSKMRERAFEILLMYIEIEKQVEIEDELVKGLENKQPKIVQACLELLRKGLSYVHWFKYNS